MSQSGVADAVVATEAASSETSKEKNSTDLSAAADSGDAMDLAVSAPSEVDEPDKRKPTKRRASSDVNGNKEKDGTKPRKKRLKDRNAPRMPLNGYVRFLNKNRERVRERNPETSFADITKLLAAEWTAMTTEEKQSYLEEAEKDKERYSKELEDYKGTDAYKSFQKEKDSAQKKGSKDSNDVGVASRSRDPEGGQSSKLMPPPSTSSSLDIPIFTEEFLEHNRAREVELRQLRKYQTEFEEQNAILSKHIENMQAAIGKIEHEDSLSKSKHAAIQQFLNQMTDVLCKSFADVPIPGTNETPAQHNIESYMEKLHHVVMNEKAGQEHEVIQERVKSAIAQLNL